MPFILPPGKLAKLSFIRKEYQAEKQVDLSEQPSWLGRPTLLGGTDVVNRKRQIEFLEKVHTILKINLLQREEITPKTTDIEWESNLTASRAMIAAALYVKSQIYGSKRRSVLYRLIEDDLGITTENYIDEEDEAECVFAARRIFLSSLNAFDDANTVLRQEKIKPFSSEEWKAFQDFLCAKDLKKLSTPQSKYPITCITQKLFGSVGAWTGATVGMLSGDVMSHSTKALSSKTQLTAFVGSSLLVFGSAGPAGVALFAPAIAERLISAFCSISLAHILGISMGIVGQGVGIGVGVPLDLAYQLLWNTCKLIGAYGQTSKRPLITGTRIKDGMSVLYGVPVEELPTLPDNYIKLSVEITDDGKLYIDGKPIEIPETGVQLPAEVIEQLKVKFKAPTTPLEKETAASSEVLSIDGLDLEEPDAIELSEIDGTKKLLSA